ncbi:MAG: tyrosine-type recombinase/integrase [Acidobacteria bacterium]|nr:tyrosine-type recombinase/integrase [Acidobacteriota bacterium]
MPFNGTNSTLSGSLKVEDAHAHRFRDTHSVSLLEQGVPVETLAMILGHADVRIAQKHYAPWIESWQDVLESG